ncbi:nucleotidyl transferase AbiEii/AbiGii toxin family protein [Pedobacter sp. Leaf176]|uniref:nucleotidyl transferase AbiEii/AbiGii toxin family protein n=1 Tax=Pedobacter sp. Leaf176 TaxID=1736286 RepID=UPI0006FA93AD|nr:nucleotidyl transferase AbiEii/AbiGii toxin family protein [Pedobacter sp. Leaf176]KQR71801.1 hypothetical protein ASF92_00330 [Pedobacter sp. Leaf176]
MHENLVRMKAVSLILKDLEQQFVFVGGATVSLYATDPELADEVRPTDDVDVIVELATYGGYADLDEKLRSLGFTNDVASGVICRYKIKGIVVDVMPTETNVMGFSNKWYPEGFQNAVDYNLEEGQVIKYFSLPYFFASKWEAYLGRGKGDYRTSKDFEDIIYVLENVDDFEKQLKAAPDNVLEYLKEEISKVMFTDAFEEGIYAHLRGGYGGADATYIKMRLQDALGIMEP